MRSKPVDGRGVKGRIEFSNTFLRTHAFLCLVTVPGRPAEKSKNGLAHRVPLSAPALEILEGLRKEKDESKTERQRLSRWVFLSPRGDAYLRDVHKATDRIRANSKIPDLKPHDLRRTAASLMTGAGVSRLVVSKILNHVESGVTRVYDRHSYDPEKRQALDAWGRRVMVIVSGLREIKTAN